VELTSSSPSFHAAVTVMVLVVVGCVVERILSCWLRGQSSGVSLEVDSSFPNGCTDFGADLGTKEAVLHPEF